MRIASSGLGMGPQHAMQIAERLYIQVWKNILFVQTRAGNSTEISPLG